mgnify:CR=1 FL=1
MITERPFRSPHHTISVNGLIGGGTIPRPGEVTLAHNGVLFLDELPEFPRSVLEVMRQPLEDGVVHIARVHASLTYPAQYMLVAAMNPCPCGNYGSDQLCTCTPGEIRRYVRFPAPCWTVLICMSVSNGPCTVSLFPTRHRKGLLLSGAVSLQPGNGR